MENKVRRQRTDSIIGPVLRVFTAPPGSTQAHPTSMEVGRENFPKEQFLKMSE